MAKNINDTVFDEATKLKLDIFGECFEEWFPVFLHSSWYKELYIFDFFAGSGVDKSGHPGSPLVLLDKAKGEDQKFCSRADKTIKFIFNEAIEDKSKELDQHLNVHIEKCSEANTCTECVYKIHVTNDDFKDIFKLQRAVNIFNNREFGKFVLLDQYGFSQIDEDVFRKLVSYPKTDFIFFISSSFISRFRKHPNTTKYIDTSKIDFENWKPNEIHRAIADYFRSLIPDGKEYYLHHFSIRKEAKGNYYGLIFGTNHTLGMEKFLKVCWRHDAFSGEANFNIDNNYEQNTLFGQLGDNVKKDTVANEIKSLILSGEISDNISGLKYALSRGCEPELFTNIIVEMEKKGKVERIGDVNNSSTNIHRVNLYEIKPKTNGA